MNWDKTLTIKQKYLLLIKYQLIRTISNNESFPGGEQREGHMTHHQHSLLSMAAALNQYFTDE